MNISDAGHPGRVEAWVVVSHPYDIENVESNTYEVLSVGAGGDLFCPGHVFEMGRAQMADIAFSPKGRVGIVPQQDGTLGVFRLDAEGRPHVVHKAFQGSFWASSVLMHPSGDQAFVLNSQWAKHGGGIYSIAISSDGSLTDEGLWAPAQLPYTMAWLPEPGQRAVVGSHDILGSPKGSSVHLVDSYESPRRLASCVAFGGAAEAIMASTAVTKDGRYVLIGDNNGFSEAPNGVAVVRIDGDRLRKVQVLEPVEDPIAIVVSPWGNPLLVISGFGNAVFIIDYDRMNLHEPFSIRGELPYFGEPAGLPSRAACVAEGPLKGHVFISENGGIRQVQFTSTGAGVVDRGLYELPTAAGAIGVLRVPR